MYVTLVTLFSAFRLFLPFPEVGKSIPFYALIHLQGIENLISPGKLIGAYCVRAILMILAPGNGHATPQEYGGNTFSEIGKEIGRNLRIINATIV